VALVRHSVWFLLAALFELSILAFGWFEDYFVVEPATGSAVPTSRECRLAERPGLRCVPFPGSLDNAAVAWVARPRSKVP